MTHELKRMTYEFSIYVRIVDADALRQAALARAIEAGLDEEDLAETFNDPADWLQILLDPGSLTGCDILESNCAGYQTMTDKPRLADAAPAMLAALRAAEPLLEAELMQRQDAGEDMAEYVDPWRTALATVRAAIAAAEGRAPETE